MCGIAGILGPRETAGVGDIRKMADALAHRGPDDEQLWTEGSIGMGFRRLAVQDPSPAGRQPMRRGERTL